MLIKASWLISDELRRVVGIQGLHAQVCGVEVILFLHVKGMLHRHCHAYRGLHGSRRCSG
jgi:hypothetical protein